MILSLNPVPKVEIPKAIGALQDNAETCYPRQTKNKTKLGNARLAKAAKIPKSALKALKNLAQAQPLGYYNGRTGQ